MYNWKLGHVILAWHAYLHMNGVYFLLERHEFDHIFAGHHWDQVQSINSTVY
jgi:hypothetical protein